MREDYLNDLKQIDKVLNKIFKEMATHEGEAVVMGFQETLGYLIKKTERKIYIEKTGDEFGRKGIEY